MLSGKNTPERALHFYMLDDGKGVHSLVFKVLIQFSLGHIWL